MYDGFRRVRESVQVKINFDLCGHPYCVVGIVFHLFYPGLYFRGTLVNIDYGDEKLIDKCLFYSVRLQLSPAILLLLLLLPLIPLLIKYSSSFVQCNRAHYLLLHSINGLSFSCFKSWKIFHNAYHTIPVTCYQYHFSTFTFPLHIFLFSSSPYFRSNFVLILSFSTHSIYAKYIWIRRPV